MLLRTEPESSLFGQITLGHGVTVPGSARQQYQQHLPKCKKQGREESLQMILQQNVLLVHGRLISIKKTI